MIYWEAKKFLEYVHFEHCEKKKIQDGMRPNYKQQTRNMWNPSQHPYTIRLPRTAYKNKTSNIFFTLYQASWQNPDKFESHLEGNHSDFGYVTNILSKRDQHQNGDNR
jgi:cyclophilin family peptidyl-prolyl cis-trans isomerase